MKITAGLGALKHYDELVDAGADELFAGFVPPQWLEKYANFTPLNRREVLFQNIQLTTMDEMRLLSRKIALRSVPVALTFNSISYPPFQYPQIAQTLLELRDLGFEDWILADPGLMLYLKERGISGRIHLSGEAGCFGPDALGFFEYFHLHRIIFPRKMTPEEMRQCIASHPQYEYEAFALNERCHYCGAFCSSLHCDELEHLCRLPYRLWGPCACEKGAPSTLPETSETDGCALCALGALSRAGITHLKVVGRGAQVQQIRQDIRLLKKALSMKEDSAEVMRNQLLGGRCSGRCYYADMHK